MKKRTRRTRRRTVHRRTTHRRHRSSGLSGLAGLASSRRRRSSRRRSGGKLGLNLTGIKSALGGGKPVAYTLAGALLARVLYGLGVKAAPTTDPRLVGALAILATVVGGIAISGKRAIAVPLAVGAAGVGLMDLFSAEIAKMFPSQPEIQAAVVQGVGKQLYALPAAGTTQSAAASAGLLNTLNPADTGMSDLPDGYGFGASDQPVGYYPDQFGLGDADLIYS